MKNKLKQIIKAKGLTATELGKLTNIAPKKIEALQAGVLKYDAHFTMDVLLPICAKLNMTSDEIFSAPLPSTFKKKTCDTALLDSAFGFLLEACTRSRASLSPKQLGKLVVLAYGAAVELHLNVSQVRGIAAVLVKAAAK